MRRYEKYKSTNLFWIGDIPTDWRLGKFNRVAFYQEGPGLRNWQFTDEGIKVICVTNITEQGINFELLQRHISVDEYESSYRHFTVQNGDYLLSSSGASWGKVAEYKSDEKVILNTSTIRLNTEDEKKLTRSFLKWMIKSRYVSEQLDILLTGSCQPNFGPTHLRQLYVVYPASTEEQTAIANYLDEKTAQIDSLIEKKQKLIELLKEERKAIINEAVSGEGKHWERKKLKYALRVNSGEGIASDKIGSDGTYPVYGGNGIMGYTEEYNSDKSDIIIGRVGAKCGNVRLVNGKKWISDNALIATVYNNYSLEYVALLLEAMNLNSMANQNAQPLITGTMVKDKVAYFPEPLMQIKIVEKVKVETKRIDATIEKIETEIGLMYEYKTALISEVVTGKVKVV